MARPLSGQFCSKVRMVTLGRLMQAAIGNTSPSRHFTGARSAVNSRGVSSGLQPLLPRQILNQMFRQITATADSRPIV